MAFRTTHSLNLDHPKVDLKSSCIALLFFLLNMSASICLFTDNH